MFTNNESSLAGEIMDKNYQIIDPFMYCRMKMLQ